MLFSIIGYAFLTYPSERLYSQPQVSFATSNLFFPHMFSFVGHCYCCCGGVGGIYSELVICVKRSVSVLCVSSSKKLISLFSKIKNETQTDAF